MTVIYDNSVDASLVNVGEDSYEDRTLDLWVFEDARRGEDFHLDVDNVSVRLTIEGARDLLSVLSRGVERWEEAHGLASDIDDYAAARSGVAEQVAGHDEFPTDGNLYVATVDNPFSIPMDKGGFLKLEKDAGNGWWATILSGASPRFMTEKYAATWFVSPGSLNSYFRPATAGPEDGSVQVPFYNGRGEVIGYILSRNGEVVSLL